MPRIPIRNSAIDQVSEFLVDLEGPLSQAQAITRALMLAGFGMMSISREEGEAVTALAEALSSELGSAKRLWRKAMRNLPGQVV